MVTVTAATRPKAPKRRRPFYTLPVVILIAVLLTAIVISALIFLPLSPVHFNQTNQVPKTDVNSLLVDLQADVAHVNVIFQNLPGSMVVLNVTADGGVGILEDPDRAVNVTFNHQTTNNSEVVIASVSRAIRWPLFYTVNVTCDVYIDFSANLSLTVRSGVGGIMMNADNNVIFQDLNLETTTGNIDARLSREVTVDGSVNVKTTTGNVYFQMGEAADVSRNVSVNLRSTTGSVNMVLAETQMSGNVTVHARTTTGSVNLSMAIYDNVGASIESETAIGGINVDVEKFSGNEMSLRSDNFPAGSNFLVYLRTSTGGININAIYETSAILS